MKPSGKEVLLMLVPCSHIPIIYTFVYYGNFVGLQKLAHNNLFGTAFV